MILFSQVSQERHCSSERHHRCPLLETINRESSPQKEAEINHIPSSVFLRVSSNEFPEFSITPENTNLQYPVEASCSVWWYCWICATVHLRLDGSSTSPSEYNRNHRDRAGNPLRKSSSQWVARANPLTSMRITDTD